MPLLFILTLLLLVLVAAITDLHSRRIPNWLVAVGSALGIGLNAFVFGLAGFKSALIGAGCAFGVYLLFYLLHAMGAGDVKLMATIGAFVGAKAWAVIFFLTAVSGAMVALVVLIATCQLRRTLWNVRLLIAHLLHFRAPYKVSDELDVQSDLAMRLPHAVNVALGTIAFLIAQHLQQRPSS
jgi:prepilin peptidase CpaA